MLEQKQSNKQLRPFFCLSVAFKVTQEVCLVLFWDLVEGFQRFSGKLVAALLQM